MSDRRAFYDRRAVFRPTETNRYYQRFLRKYFSLLIPPNQRVLEVGSGMGDLLASLKPVRGLGIDFSQEMVKLARGRHPNLQFEILDACSFSIEEKFDYILLIDLVNDLPDVQRTLQLLRNSSHTGTRLVVSCFNTLWRPILSIAQRIGAKSPTPVQSWLSKKDTINLLQLAGWEVIKTDSRMIWPLATPWLATFLNRWIAAFVPHLCLTIVTVSRLKPQSTFAREYSCSVVIPARNEAGNIEAAVRRMPELGLGTEIIFVEGHSSDSTWEEIQRTIAQNPNRPIRAFKQLGMGKGDAVREGFSVASGDLLFILDADLAVPPEELSRFYEVARCGTAEFLNGVRFVYPIEDEAMKFLNMLANKAFSVAFSWILGQHVKDTLCGTKVLFRKDFEAISENRTYFGKFDPFGDFDLIFGATKLNLRIADLPTHYYARTYGNSNVRRWRHGWSLLRMVVFAACRLKFLKCPRKNEFQVH